MTDKKNNKLERKLGVWGVDNISKDGKVFAEDYYCVGCYSLGREVRAEVFWPAMDPDVRSFPYCRSCVDYQEMKLLIDFEDFE